MPTSGGIPWYARCGYCHESVTYEAAIDLMGFTLRHNTLTPCPHEGALYDVNHRLIDTLDRTTPTGARGEVNATTDVEYTRMQRTTYQSLMAQGGGAITLGNIHAAWGELNPTEEMAASHGRSETNAERLHRMGQKIVKGKIVSIMEGNGSVPEAQNSEVQQVHEADDPWQSI